MAAQIPFNVIADVLTKLGVLAAQQIGSACGVVNELKKLSRKLETIKGVLLDAEQKQKESHAVRAWVRRLRAVVYDADDLLGDFEALSLQPGGVAEQVSRFFSSSNQLVFRSKMSRSVKNIKEEVDEILKEIPLLNLIRANQIDHGTAENSNWRETHSFVLTSETVERDEEKEEIIELLVSSGKDKILSAVAIIGIGGLGKTTLAQLVYADERVVEVFEPRIWICVSDDFDLKLQVKKILEASNGGVAGKLESLEVLKVSLHEKLGQKRFLLVLDDVWSDDFEKWDKLRTLLMVGAQGSKILVTTRNTSVASTMGIDHLPFHLNGLKDDQAWDLFSKIAFVEEPEKAHPNLVKIGKEIVNMCRGVPLVIKTLGAMLRLKTEETQWLSVKSNTNLLSLGVENDNVLSVLKLSYDNLPIHLKQCFTYCALFPKDYEIEKKLLVQLWMAQGYIQPLDENVGDQYFNELLSRSMLEEARKDAHSNILSCKMHDLIHDLAQSVIRCEALVLKDETKEILEEVRHVLFFKPMNLKLKSPKLKHIRTFLSIPVFSEHEDDSTRSIDFSRFKYLRVLSLYGFNVKKLPKSLGELNHLRYLDLSYNEFEVLSNGITRLKNLQTLRIVGCFYLKKFPKDIRELVNLRHWVNDEELSHMPCGIGELTMLQNLPVFVVGNVGNGRDVGRLSELRGLNSIKGDLSIVKLDNAMAGHSEANLRGKQYIQSLRLQWEKARDGMGQDVELVMEGLQPHSNLKQLKIEGYGGERFPSWMMNGGLSSMLPNLTMVHLEGCSRCQTLPCFVQLPYLKILKLRDFQVVENMECSSKGLFFPSLEELSLLKMPKLKELWRRDLSTEPPSSFPCLSQLNIYKCDELAFLELHSSPLLSCLFIFHCPKLTYLVLPPSPLLSLLDIRSCNDLASLELHSSPVLSSLGIRHCRKFKSLLLPPSPLLSKLDIRSCGDLLTLELHSSPSLSSLRIRQCPKLASLLLPSSCLLSKLDIKSCVVLVHLLVPPSPLLSLLEIGYCYQLASLELHASPLLSKLEVYQCPRLTSLLLPPSPLLSQLSIGNCGDLASLELHSCPLLSVLEIRQCAKLTSLLVPPCLALSLLDIWSCNELASLELHLSPSLSSLVIHECPKLTSLKLPNLPCLEKLELYEVPEGVLWKLILLAATSLEFVSIGRIHDLMSPPDELHRHISTLQTLRIWDCSCLVMLPHWIGNLTSLTDLQIDSCHQLLSLPEGMRSLTNLQRLEISDCPYLSERCQRENGEDWAKIAHVPHISIY